MNHYPVFYNFGADDDSVDSESPVSASLADIRDRLVPRLVGDDDFLGLIDDRGNTFQLANMPDGGRYWAELIVAPPPGDRREYPQVYGGELDREALARTLARLPATFQRTDFPDFTEQPS